MKKFGLESGSSVLYMPPGQHESVGISSDRYVHEYRHWHLILESEENRQKRGLAAGLIIARRQLMFVTELSAAEWQDLRNVVHDGPEKLCDKVGVTFTGRFSGPEFNNGELAGQSDAQVHGHLYPVIVEQLPFTIS